MKHSRMPKSLFFCAFGDCGGAGGAGAGRNVCTRAASAAESAVPNVDERTAPTDISKLRHPPTTIVDTNVPTTANVSMLPKFFHNRVLLVDAPAWYMIGGSSP